MQKVYEPLRLDDTIAAVWPVAGDRRAPRRGRHPVYLWMRWAFMVLAALSGVALLVTLVWATLFPTLPGPGYFALINVNVVVLALLLLYVMRRVVVIMLDRRGKLRGGRLHYRVLGVFAFLAIVPAVGVGGTAIYLLNEGIDGWFAAKVNVALEGGQQVAAGYLNESGRSLAGEVAVLSRDPLWQLPPMLLSQATVSDWLRAQLNAKRLDDLALVDSDGQVMASGTGFSGAVLPSEVLRYLQNTSLNDNATAVVPEVFRLSDGSRMIALAPLKGGWWLVAQRSLNPEMLARIDETAAAYAEYKQLRLDRDQVRLLVSLFLLLLLAATVTGAVWAAIRLANKIVGPVTMLVHGTNRVSAGDLSVRLEPRDDGELGVLTQAFNRMTLQLAANRDLLERKNRELDERRRLIEAILTGVSAGVVAVDEDGVVRVANSLAQNMLQLTTGVKLAAVLPELAEVVQQASGQNGEQMPLRGVLQREIKVTLAEGDTRTLMVRLLPQLGEGSRGVVLTFDDITPLIGAQRLAAWRDVARRLAHEIKNPLTPIQLSAERLKRRYLQKLPEEDRSLFAQLTETIVQQSEEMRRMTNEFSDFARMPQAKPEQLDLLALAENVVVLQRARGEVQFKTDFASVSPAQRMIMADAGQVQRVLTNLLENAYNAIAEREGTNVPQGVVEIVASAQQDGMLLLEIRDNGRGLPVDVEVEHLFDPYVTTRKGGTGLGLAIVKKVMDEHSGTVRLLRRTGGGTVVELGFPRLA